MAATDTLSRDDACRLSRAFNQVADLADPADRRINEWLKGQIAHASRTVEVPLREIAADRHRWFEEGRSAFGRGEPISNAPRSPDPVAAKRWREGWLHARDASAQHKE